MKQLRSKYLGMKFDHNWTCVEIGIATVQSSRAKSPYHRGYYYLLARDTGDNKFEKQIRVNATYMAKIGRGEMLVDEYADRIFKRQSKKATQKVSYFFKKK